MVGYDGGVGSIDTEVRNSFLFFQVLLRRHRTSVVILCPMPAVSKMCDFVLIGLVAVHILHVSVLPSETLFLPGKPMDYKKYR